MTAATVVLAGGLGTRIAAVTGARRPKAMLDVAGRPVIDRKLDELRRNGVTRVFVLTGHGASELHSHLARQRLPGVTVRAVHDGERLLGTGGAIAAALPLLPDVFWVTYGDTLLDVAMAPLEPKLTPMHEGLLVVVHNRDAVQPSNTSIQGDSVVAYSKDDPPGTHEHLDYGLLLLRRSAFADIGTEPPFDLGEVLRGLVARRALLAHVARADFHDVGSPEAWRATSEHYVGR